MISDIIDDEFVVVGKMVDAMKAYNNEYFEQLGELLTAIMGEMDGNN